MLKRILRFGKRIIWYMKDIIPIIMCGIIFELIVIPIGLFLNKYKSWIDGIWDLRTFLLTSVLIAIVLKIYSSESERHKSLTKQYEIYRIIIGSSNITSAALTSNREWNTRLISTEQGEVAKEIVAEFNELWNSKYALSFDDFYENYKERYKIIKHQREIAKQEEITSIEKYKLQPNSMQVGFITNLKRILAAGEDRALLISATGTGKTYASAFAMRELRFKRVLFLVHRGQLARQTKKSYEKVFAKSVSMGLVGAGYHEYNADYVFATVQTLNRDEHLLQYAEDTFDCKDIPTYKYDGSLVMGNLMNAATSLGLGSIWVHRAKEEFESEFGKKILADLGIEGNYEGIGHCAIGYAAAPANAPTPRKDNYVYYVR